MSHYNCRHFLQTKKKYRLICCCCFCCCCCKMTFITVFFVFHVEQSWKSGSRRHRWTALLLSGRFFSLFQFVHTDEISRESANVRLSLSETSSDFVWLISSYAFLLLLLLLCNSIYKPRFVRIIGL